MKMSISTVMNNNDTFYNFSATSHLQRYSQYLTLESHSAKRGDAHRPGFLRHSVQNVYLTSRVDPSWCIFALGLRFGPWCSMGNVLLFIRTTGWGSSARSDELCNFVVLKLSECICFSARLLVQYMRVHHCQLSEISGISGHAHLA